MSSVTFSTTVGGDGSTITDDDNATTGLGNGGSLIRLVPMMQQAVNVAEFTANAALSVLGNASTSSTSSSSLTISLGSKSLSLVETGKAYVVGQFVIIASISSPSNNMIGQVTSFSGTSLVVNVTTINGSGTIAAWSISVTSVPAAANTNGGATETSSAVDMTLSSASMRVQAVTATALNVSVRLPDATTLEKGGVLFVIKNTGTNTFAVRNASGGLIAAISAGQIIGLYLSNNTTSAGTWVVGNQSMFSFLNYIFSAAILTINATSSIYTSVTTLSATQALATYQGTSAYLDTCVLNISGSTITAGAVLTVNAVNSKYTSVTTLSATQALVTYQNGSTGVLETRVLNISGSTITAGAVLIVNAVASTFTSVTTLSATQALVTYRGTSAYLQTCVLNISGSTVTAGAILTVNAVNSSYISVTTLSATQALVAYQRVGGFIEACVLSISGSTVTANSIASSDNGYDISVTTLSATQALVTYINNTSTYLETRVLNISGSTVTFGDILTLNTVSNSAYTSVTTLSATQALVAYKGVSGCVQTCVLNISGSIVTASPISSVNAVSSIYTSVTTLSATQALVIYGGTSNYLQTCSLETVL